MPSPEHYFAAEDVGDDARLLGLIAFLSSSYSAGTPLKDDFVTFPYATSKERRQIAPSAFVARLVQRLLGHPKGGALAVVGHVDQLWLTSFVSQGGSDIGLFENTLRRLMTGHTIGASMEVFNQRYRQLSVTLGQKLREAVLFGERGDQYELISMDIVATDIRNYIVLGDPAVRLPTGDDSVIESARPTIEPVTVMEQSIQVPPKPSGPREGLDDDVLVFNGVNGATSDYLLSPMTAEQIATIALGRPLAPDAREDLRRHYQHMTNQYMKNQPL